MKNLPNAIFGLAMVFASSAIADDGLYQDVFDPSSSFVRVVAPGQTVVSIDGHTLRDFDGGVSRYVNVMPGDIDVVLPSGNVEMPVAASTHYTVVMTQDGETTIIADDIANSPAKADLSLYNMTDREAVDLFVPAANAVAIGEIAPLQSQTVSVRAPLTLDFEVRAGDDTLSAVSQVELVRGAGVSIVLVALDDGFSAVAVPNSYLKN